MSKLTNAISWFQVPAVDFSRAVKFYASVLQKPLREETMLGERMAIFPYEQHGVGGAVTQAEYLQPSLDGNNVFLLVEDELDNALARVAAAGGHVMTPKTRLGEDMGHFAVICDTEGNRIGLHSLV
ncbi:MAG TPA: VOC family protein [Gammaproteobacteria bacterium]|nr:VOC family protein [Gammaproteobacteria bacterium]